MADIANKTKSAIYLIYRVVQYNLKIIFAGRFAYFLFAAIAFFVLVTAISLFSDSIPDESSVYNLLLFPGLLLVFYPATYGIQNDKEVRMLEILFGIPNYRYKVWLVRLLMIFLIVFTILLVLSFLSNYSIAIIPIVEMTIHLMFPVLFMGMLSFMFSAWIKNGNATAVVVIVVGMFFWIMVDMLEYSQWNVFLNPLNLPSDISEAAWSNIVIKNRLYLITGAAIAALFGLFNLQKREKFV